MNKNAEYCSKYRNKNIDKIHQKDKGRKKFERTAFNTATKVRRKKEKRQREKETR